MDAGELARRLGASLSGDGALEIEGVAPLDRASARELSFFSNPKYREGARRSSVGSLLATSAQGLEGRTVLVHPNPYAALARALEIFHPPKIFPPGVHPTAVVGAGSSVHPEAHLGPLVVLGRECTVGRGAVLEAGVVAGDRCEIGESCHLYPHAVLYDGTELGARVIVHAGVVLGSDGFGYAQEGGRHLKVPQVGRVVVGEDVEIGANTAVDRGALDETRIGAGTKIDNLVQIAHNVRTGRSCILVAQAGISGSTTLGEGVVVAGQSGAVGHIRLGDGAKVGAKSAVTKDVPAGGFVTGHPAQEHRLWLRERALVHKLESLFARVKTLEAELESLRKDKEHA